MACSGLVWCVSWLAWLAWVAGVAGLGCLDSVAGRLDTNELGRAGVKSFGYKRIIVRIQTIYRGKEKPPLVRRGLLSGCLVEDEPRTPFVTAGTAGSKHANTRLVWHGFDLAVAPLVG